MTLNVYQVIPSPHNDGRNGWHAIIGYDLKGKPDYIGGYGWGEDAIEAMANAYGDAAYWLEKRTGKVGTFKSHPAVNRNAGNLWRA